jgi:hypothetical protein
MAKRQGQVARALWSGGLLVGIAFVVWLVLLAPRFLVPAASQTDLSDVPAA